MRTVRPLAHYQDAVAPRTLGALSSCLSISNRLAFTSYTDGSIRSWELLNAELGGKIPLENFPANLKDDAPAIQLQSSPDGKHFAAISGKDGIVKIFSAPKPKPPQLESWVGKIKNFVFRWGI
eukprot:GILI01023213.1.p3 GENE.GILI01023213.1~~GILI01023213.1.p3  ORF type:complete len:134 (+),score=30.94 GILI01023213.1:34-402(+)